MTLVEVLMASSILLVCLTSLAGVLSGSVISSTLARTRDEATNLANERLERARSMDYDRVGLHYTNGVYGDPAGDIVTPAQDGRFTVTTECAWVRIAGRAAYKQVTVHVSWQQPSAGEIAVTTMIYGKSDLAINGDLAVMLRYREDAEPVQGATVAIVAADATARSVVSDSTGEGFFGQVAIGAIALTVTPPVGCVVDTSTISSVSIAADALTTLIVYIQRPAQATVRVTDTSGTVVTGASVTLRRSDGAVLPVLLTGAGGDAVFTALLYGEYSATIEKTGYSPATAPVSVSLVATAPVVPVTISPLVGVGLQVRVFDANATPIQGATVTVRREGNTTPLYTGTVGTNGEISFTGMNAGIYNATVEKSGYVSQVRSTSMYDGDHDILDFVLEPVAATGSMRVTTYDHHGNRQGSTRTIVSGPGYYDDDLRSDANGYLNLSGLVPGSYRVRCFARPASTATVLVNSGQTAFVSVSQKR